MITLKVPEHVDLDAASALCLRSKAYWGYDAEFMAACVEELTLVEDDIANDKVILACDRDGILGVAQVSCDHEGCFLEKLFVDPDQMGKGVGRKLFDWGCAAAAEFGAKEMIVEADPDAVPFYLAMGCIEAGFAPSGSIPGRQLPRLIRAIGRAETIGN